MRVLCRICALVQDESVARAADPPHWLTIIGDLGERSYLRRTTEQYMDIHGVC